MAVCVECKRVVTSRQQAIECDDCLRDSPTDGWRGHLACTTRNGRSKCHVTVKQLGNIFTPGGGQHQHPPSSGAYVKARIKRDIKDSALANLFTSATSVAETLMLGAERVPNLQPVNQIFP